MSKPDEKIEDVSVILSNIDIASNIQVFLIENNIQKDGPTSNLWEDVLKLSKYIHQQTTVAVQALEMQKNKIAAVSSSSASRYQHIKQPQFPDRMPSEFKSPAFKTTESSRSGFDRFLNKALSPSKATAEERSLVSVLNSTNNSMTFNLSRPPSPIASIGANSSHVAAESIEVFPPPKMPKSKLSNRKLIDSVDANVMDILSSISDAFKPAATQSSDGQLGERATISKKNKSSNKNTTTTTTHSSTMPSAAIDATQNEIDRNSLSLLKSKKKLSSKNRESASVLSTNDTSKLVYTATTAAAAILKTRVFDSENCFADGDKSPVGCATFDSTAAAAARRNITETPETLVTKHSAVPVAADQVTTPYVDHVVFDRDENNFYSCDTPTIGTPSRNEEAKRDVGVNANVEEAFVAPVEAVDSNSLQPPTCSNIALFSTPPRKIKSQQGQLQQKCVDAEQQQQPQPQQLPQHQMSNDQKSSRIAPRSGSAIAASEVYSTPQISRRISEGRTISSASRTVTGASGVKSHRTTYTGLSKTPPNKMNLRQSWKLAIPRSNGGKTLAKQFEEAGAL